MNQPNAIKTPLANDDHPKCVRLLETLLADPNCEPFREPVAWKELQLFDYPQIVERPMDFSTLRSNLLDGKFEAYEDFLADL